MHKFEARIRTLDVLLQPEHDRQTHFNAGVGADRDGAIDDRLGEPDAAANIKNAQASQIGAAKPTRQHLQQDFASHFDSGLNNVMIVPLQFVRDFYQSEAHLGESASNTITLSTIILEQVFASPSVSTVAFYNIVPRRLSLSLSL